MCNKKSAIYLLGDMRLRGFVSEAEEGLYWFNTTERIKANKRDILVSATEIKIIIK